MRKYVNVIALLLIVLFFTAGCGETVNGVVKDFRRIGTGVKTVFIRET